MQNIEQLIKRAEKGRWTLLNLSKQDLSEIPTSIGSLVKLRTLDLSDNRLTSIPDTIGSLVNLKQLNLRGNTLSKVPLTIGNLSRLESLDLSENKITVLPEELSRLERLHELQLSKNAIRHFPDSFGKLTGLQTLIASKNEIELIPMSIATLPNLLTLIISDNKLSQIPNEIWRAEQLKYLDVSGNRISIIPRTISKCSRLTRLLVSSNRIEFLPPNLVELARLQYFEFDRNPLKSPPTEVSLQGMDAVLSFLEELHTADGERFDAKVLLLGQGGVGKTSLLRRVCGKSFSEEEMTTHGVEVERVHVQHPGRQSQRMRLDFWDFAGQEIEHATHQFFMSPNSVFVLVWNARHGQAQGRLDYWLELIRSRAPAAPVVLVATHIDQRIPDVNFSALQKRFAQLIGQVSVDNRSGAGIDALIQMIAECASKLPQMGQPWPANWSAVEEELSFINEHHITFERFEAICRLQGLNSPLDHSTLAETLHNLGIILNFQSDPVLRELVILRPNWITKAISYALTDRATSDRTGTLYHSDFPRIWQHYDQSLHPAFFALMNKFELSYQLEDVVGMSIVPALLPYEEPRGAEVQHRLGMIFRMSSVPPGLVSRFIVRTHRYTTNIHWREGAFLSYDGQKARIELFEHQRELHATVDGSAPSNLFAILTDTIRQILEDFPGLVVESRIPCTCKMDKDGERCEYSFSYLDCVHRLERGRHTIECNVSLKDVSLVRLLYGIHHLSADQVQKDVAHVQDANDENFRQLVLLGQRGVIQAFASLESISARCPNVFTISMRRERVHNETHSKSDDVILPQNSPTNVEKLLNDIKSAKHSIPAFSEPRIRRRGHKAASEPNVRSFLDIRLICQSEFGWHYATLEPTYTLPDSAELREELAPILFELRPLLRHVVPLSGPGVTLKTHVQNPTSSRNGIECERVGRGY
jgi:internalin A